MQLLHVQRVIAAAETREDRPGSAVMEVSESSSSRQGERERETGQRIIQME